MTSDHGANALRRAAAALLLAAFLATGCESELPAGNVRQTLTLAEIPPAVMKAAAGALPKVKFEDAWKNVDRTTKTLHSYEVRGRTANGKVREVRVSPAGDILETE